MRAFIPVELGEVGLIALPPPARSNGSCSFPASRFPMWVALIGEGWVGFQGRGRSAASAPLITPFDAPFTAAGASPHQRDRIGRFGITTR